MRIRPWPLVILALIQIITPFSNLLFNAYTLKVSPWLVLNWIFERGPIGIFETLFLMPIAGIAIYRMTKTSYVVFFIAMFWSAYSQYHQSLYNHGNYPIWSVWALIALEMTLAVYFLTPSVRMTYFNPRVRWWESKPRYEVQAPCQIAKVQFGGAEPQLGASDLTGVSGVVINLSEGGAYLRSESALLKGDQVRLYFKVITLHVEVSGIIVHAHQEGDQKWNYGIQFLHTPHSAQLIDRLVRGLKIIGVGERSNTGNFTTEFGQWIERLIKSGKGLLPEIHDRK